MSAQLKLDSQPGAELALSACELTILIPCLNEAETIVACVRNARAFLMERGVEGEVLVSDNGSDDDSRALAAAAGARVVRATVRGYGGALAGGIEAAKGRFIIMGDADDSYDLRRLDGFLLELRGGAQLVMGNRFRGGIASGAMPLLHRYVGNPVLSAVGRALFPSAVSDFHCGLRGFCRESVLALDLRTTGMEFASEMVVRASLSRLRICEVPTNLRKDGRSRRPHLRTWRDGWRHLRFLLLHSPRWTFLYPGICLAAAGLLLMAVSLPAPVRIVGAVSLGSHTPLVAGFAILLGVQLCTFGVIARRYAQRTGLLPPKTGIALEELLTVERFLYASAVLVALAVGGFGWLAERGLRDVSLVLRSQAALRVLIFSCFTGASGVQLAFSGLLLGVLDLPINDALSRQERLRRPFPQGGA